MTTTASLDAYRSHELNFYLKTSSGDTLSLNLQNEQSLSLERSQSDSSDETSFSFSSMQAFSFELNSNGLSDQDKQEIKDFLKSARPLINKFINELDNGNGSTPLNKIASSVTDMMGDLKQKDDHVKKHAQKGIVDLFDQSVKEVKHFEKMIDRIQTLMQKILDGFDSTAPDSLYA